MNSFASHRWFASWPLALAMMWGSMAAPGPIATDLTHDLFHSTNLLVISITVPPEGQRELAATTQGSGHSKPKARAVVQEGGRVYRDVAVQLKGTTTFQTWEGMPSLTLDFNQFVRGQRFHGLSKISLNNSFQDPTRLHEKFARELFAAAGVPVPRADHALVTLNGRPLGLYVLVEGYDKTFLKRHFATAKGNFYEAGVLQDIDRPLQFKSGQQPDDHSDVDQLLEATRESDPDRRYAAVTALVDVERFFAMVAVESMLCHSDSYSMNRNNYRLYHDPEAGRFVFLPHNMDRILGTHRSGLDLPVVPPTMGVVARALLSTPEGRQRYVATAGTLFTNLFDATRLCHRVGEIEAKIKPARSRFSELGDPGGSSSGDQSDAAADLCRRIKARAAELRLQFAQLPNLLAVSPEPEFDSSGSAPLSDWRIRWELNKSPAQLTVAEREGRPALKVQSAGGALSATLYCRLRFPLDRYRLTGRMSPLSPPDLRVTATVQRYSVGRFAAVSHSLGVRGKDYFFGVEPILGWEEVEFVYPLRAATNTVWLDPSSLRLIRGDPFRK